ncbi:cell division protein FtsQ/DivIB [Streptomyces sp. NPDC008313]|uniref:cell division protein FtsQ/DivIB n=1 Tax=Streptomyces sp. NPDC008313 TaxID=3364826 RepID=UPI0036E40C9C
MAGPTTAERGERKTPRSGPPRLPRLLRLRRPRRIIILLLALVVLAAGTLWTLYGSSWLRVRKVSASGTRVLTAEQVLETADVPVGSPLISVDTGAIEARLRRELPRIDTVEVVRSWPHGIGVKVTERTPVLVVGKDGGDGKGDTGEEDAPGENAGKSGEFVEVDAKGVRFATVPSAPKGVPLLVLAVPRSVGGGRFGTDRLVREAVRVARALPDAVARDTQVVKVRSFDAIALELSGERTVVWGSGEKGRAKAATLGALMKAAPKARHFDVSVPTAPASSVS